ncbi:hypothetical protein V2G26_007787 [Clonostachys chloroleuca]
MAPTFPKCTASDKHEMPTLQDAHYAQSRLAQLHKDDRRLRQLFDLKVLPSMMMLALIFGIESTAFSNAVVFGRTELDLSANQVSWLYSAPYILQIPLQFPVARLSSDMFPLDQFGTNTLYLSAVLFNLMPDANSTLLMACRVLSEVCILLPLVVRTQSQVALRMINCASKGRHNPAKVKL